MQHLLISPYLCSCKLYLQYNYSLIIIAIGTCQKNISHSHPPSSLSFFFCLSTSPANFSLYLQIPSFCTTPLGPRKVSLKRCPLIIQGGKCAWDLSRCPYYRGVRVVITGVSLMRGSTIIIVIISQSTVHCCFLNCHRQLIFPSQFTPIFRSP